MRPLFLPSAGLVIALTALSFLCSAARAQTPAGPTSPLTPASLGVGSSGRSAGVAGARPGL